MVSVLLIIGNIETSDLIKHHVETEKRETLAEVLPPDLYDNEPLATAVVHEASGAFTSPITMYTATKQELFSGAALQSSVWGWGSDIQFIVAVNASGTITGVRVITHKETPGLADKIEISKDDWITGFTGKSLLNTPEADWKVKKDGGKFDQFTGATITPRAVVKGVHQALLQLEQFRREQRIAPDAQASSEVAAQAQQDSAVVPAETPAASNALAGTNTLVRTDEHATEAVTP